MALTGAAVRRLPSNRRDARAKELNFFMKNVKGGKSRRLMNWANYTTF
jgi:hypothetical protein